MKTLVVMNFCTGEIDIYNISNDTEINEDWFKKHDYNTDEIYWMFTEKLTININKD